jgi:hypothetical protein
VRLQFGNDLVKMRGGHLCFIVDKKKVWSKIETDGPFPIITSFFTTGWW